MKKITLKTPSSFVGKLCWEALPVGNGKTSAMLCGNAKTERLYINRFNRWEGEEEIPLPDVRETLAKTRKLIDEGKYSEGNKYLANVLREKGYTGDLACPSAPIECKFHFKTEGAYRKYSRGIDLETGEAFVRFYQNERHIHRRLFVSRACDQIVFNVFADKPFAFKLEKPSSKELIWELLCIDGQKTQDEKFVYVENTTSFLFIASFEKLSVPVSYEAALSAHLPLYKEAIGDAELCISDGDHTNEWLLENAAQEGIGAELLEKLWRFGRYVFVSGTAEGGYPFPLYGLWNGDANAPFSQNVANENVQCMYWQAPVGGYAKLMRPLIDYYFEKMSFFRESAERMYGCKGIFVSVYTTPQNSYPMWWVPVILHCIGCAAWLSKHFYDYYRYTGDKEYLKEKILPFMLEAAAFYEDYLLRDKEGKIKIMPSVSPENTPKNFMPENFEAHYAHVNPTVWNATLDFALLKELLTNLLSLSKEVEIDEKRLQTWQDILEDIPEYMVNSDGALKEWMDEGLEDYYKHRHLSHLYPLFPGEEISKDHSLAKACEKAVALREFDGMVGWTMPHMASIYARLGRGEDALNCLDLLAESCTLNNLFTTTQDYRDMGITIPSDSEPYCIQLDALLATVNAVQEMLLNVRGNTLEILPACPAILQKGEVKNWRYPQGKISFSWELNGYCKATITAERDCCIIVRCGLFQGEKERTLCLKAGEKAELY